MGRISIDVTEEQEQKLSALAERKGKSVEDFVLGSCLSSLETESDILDAMRELESLVDHRMRRAQEEGFSTRSVQQIFDQARREIDPRSGA